MEYRRDSKIAFGNPSPRPGLRMTSNLSSTIRWPDREPDRQGIQREEKGAPPGEPGGAPPVGLSGRGPSVRP